MNFSSAHYIRVYCLLLSGFIFLQSYSLGTDFTFDDIPDNCEWTLYNYKGEAFGSMVIEKKGNELYGLQGGVTRWYFKFMTPIAEGLSFRGEWVMDESRKGEIRVYFDSPRSFKVDYNNIVAPNRWGKMTASTSCALPARPRTNIAWDCLWDSDYGDFTWRKDGQTVWGFYGDPSLKKEVRGHLEEIDGITTLIGHYYTAGKQGGEMKFAFHGSNSFKGWYKQWGVWTAWNGQTDCSRSGGTTPVIGFGIEDIRWDCRWDSDYGDISWRREGQTVWGFYGDPNLKKEVRGHLREVDGILTLIGHYYTAGKQGGEMKFSFEDPNTFKGWYKQWGVWTAWNGESLCARRGRNSNGGGSGSFGAAGLIEGNWSRLHHRFSIKRIGNSDDFVITIISEPNRRPLSAYFDGTHLVVPEWNSKGKVGMKQIDWGGELWIKEGAGTKGLFGID